MIDTQEQDKDPVLPNIVFEVSTGEIRPEKEINGIQTGRSKSILICRTYDSAHKRL